MQSYLTIENEAQDEFIEKRSRFIGTIRHVTTEEQALDLISNMRSIHWKANHNCYAYILRDGNIQRYSDDGEPQGTAGVPMLEVLKREQITDAVAVATRYFGGVLLGAGGLVRAYSHSAKIALDASKIIRMCQCVEFALELPYSQYESVYKLLEPYPMQLLDTGFADTVTLYIRMREDVYPSFSLQLTEFSAGRLEPVVTGSLFTSI